MLSADASLPCNGHVTDLPDLYRRSPNYFLSESELAVQDNLLAEGWYNIRHHLPATLPQPGEQGACGTVNPAFISST